MKDETFYFEELALTELYLKEIDKQIEKMKDKDFWYKTHETENFSRTEYQAIKKLLSELSYIVEKNIRLEISKND